MIIAIITARGGSKRIPNKCLKKLCGKPLIYYIIKTALNTGLIDRVVVSTDSLEIAKVATEFGAEVPFMRPQEFAQDNTPSSLVIAHALHLLDEDYKACVTLQPTSPLLLPEDIDKGIKQLFFESNFRVIRSITPVEIHPEWLYSIDADGRIVPAMPDISRQRPSQSLPQYYTLNGCFTIARKDNLGEGEGGCVIPHERAIDIDTMEDFKRAEDCMNRGC